MKIGLIGFAGSGKTTIFNLLTGQHLLTGPGGQRVTHLGVTRVPDDRVDWLAAIYRPRKTTYAEIIFSDLPGEAPGDHATGLSPRLVGELREMDVLACTLRAFENPALEEAPDPRREFEALESELILADLQVIEARLERLAKITGHDLEKQILARCQAWLEKERPLRDLDLRDDEWAMLRGFRFLSQKRLLVLLNTAESDPRPALPELEARLRASGLGLLPLCATLEGEILELDPADRAAFLADLGVTRTGRERFIQESYQALDLISFLTTGEDECRAWTIPRGTPAQQAAGRIHSDIERGFIRGEVISFADFETFGSEASARKAGRYRLEGKQYAVQDGDIINFRFNV